MRKVLCATSAYESDRVVSDDQGRRIRKWRPQTVEYGITSSVHRQKAQLAHEDAVGRIDVFDGPAGT